MIIFNACLKIIKKHTLSIFIWIGIFALMASMSSKSNNYGTVEGFSATNFKVAVINNDNDNELSNALEDYIKNNSKEATIGTSKEALEDALLYGIADYILIIPENYGNDFASENRAELGTYEAANTYGGVLIDALINNYLTTYESFITGIKDITEKEAVEKTNAVMSKELEVNMQQEDAVESTGMRDCFNFAAYIILALDILCTGTLIAAFNNKEIKRRNIVSPVRSIKLNLAQIVANFVLIIFVAVINIGVEYLIVGDQMISAKGGLYIVNYMALSIVAMSIGFLISTCVHSDNGRSAIANTVSLACAFLSGVFVPLSMLGSGIQKVASILPSYWYVKASNEIYDIPSTSFTDAKNVWIYMGIEIIFAVTFLTIGMVINKQKSTGERG